MDFMKSALQKKLQGFKDKKHLIHDGDAMHEGGEHQEHPDLKSMHEHEKSGSDLAPPIVHAKPGQAEHDDELMAEHDVEESGQPNAHVLDNMGEEQGEAEHEKEEMSKLDQILKALGGHGGAHGGRAAGSLRERVADKAKAKHSEMFKSKKY